MRHSASAVLLASLLLTGCPAQDRASSTPTPPKPAAARTYPSFPDALAEAPEWLSAQAPFDVAEFLKVPPAENAAPLYLDALFEFSPDLAPCFPEPGTPLEEETKRRTEVARRREEEFSRLYEAWRNDPSSIDPVALDAALVQYEAGFQKLATAQQRPRCGFQTGCSFYSLLPHANESRLVIRVVACRTWLDLKKGDFERPIQGVESVLRLSRDLRPRGAFVCQLVSVVLDGACCNDLVPAILAARGLDAQHCDRLLAALARHEQETIDPVLEGLRWEYVMIRTFVHDLEHHTGPFAPPVSRGQALLEILQAIGVNELDAKALERLIAKTDFPKQLDLLNRFYRAAARLSGATSSQRQKALTDVDQIIDEATRNKHIIALWLPNMSPVSEAVTRDATYHRGAKCLLALRRWQLTNTTPPVDLAAVVKAAGMADVPIDPYSDRPFRMTPQAGQPVIYSVGKDGKDDQARLEWDLNTDNPQGDIVFRLPVPQ